MNTLEKSSAVGAGLAVNIVEIARQDAHWHAAAGGQCVFQRPVAPGSPGDIVIADDLSSHEVAGVHEAIEDAWCNIALSPALRARFELHRKFFSKSGTLLRKAEHRTVDGLRNAIGRLLDCFIPWELVLRSMKTFT
ncbi:hypothetical protein [Verminephrobacter eiseniae]|uniref:hypothetical protein n=1 Tax=Verminephrobacter eiseniae TaxID=364317 RepID=UPI00223723CC|nr:hypothetical protein [Verminephrobacter eiseniae]